MQPPRLLLVDDELSFVRGLTASLRHEGFAVDTCHDGRDVLAQVQLGQPDLVLLDVMLPGTDGFTLCREIRSQYGTPVILLTARTGDTDKIVGLELGADDYVTKPFNSRELVARIRAVLRRSHSQPTPRPAVAATLAIGPWLIDPERQEVRCDGRPVPLKPKEFDLLLYLARHPDRVFDREQLLAAVWGYDFAGDSRTVDVHMRRLRQKLEADPARPRHLLTRWGRGYLLSQGEDSGNNWR